MEKSLDDRLGRRRISKSFASMTRVPPPSFSSASSLTSPVAREVVRAAPRRNSLQPRQPALIALAPSADAISHPVFFHRDLAVELMTRELFLREHVVAPTFEGGETLLETPCRPRSSHTVARDNVFKNRRSWLMSTSAERI